VFKEDNTLTAAARSTIRPHATLVTRTENFETGTKTAYAAADVTLSTGVWNLNDALLGNTTADKKTEPNQQGFVTVVN
jgi:endonuclease G